MEVFSFMNKKRNKIIVSVMVAVILSVTFLIGEFFVGNHEAMAASKSAGVSYTTHVQSYGWLSYVSNGATSGTSGKAKRVEAVKIKLTNADVSGSIQYRTYCQTYGWKPWVSNGALSGTTGEAKRVEAIQIKLTGEMAKKYDVYYRAYCQTYGWLDWTKNGATAGTSNEAKRIESIQIKLVTKNSAAPGKTTTPYRHPMVQYRTHVQTYGWQGYVKDGAESGTTGQAKRLEGINISLVDKEYTGDIQYRTHVQTYGWMNWVSNGKMSGTSGQAKRLEAIQIKLTGQMAEKYDVYYRVHAQNYGWLGWAKNGASAGTAGYAYRLESIQIKILPKGSAAPGSTSGAFKEKVSTVAVTGVTLNRTSANINVGGETTLTATILPSNATNKTVTWSSSNTSIATVSSTGKVTGKKAGTATITAKSSNGKTASCKVTVKDNTTVPVDTPQGNQENLYQKLFDLNNKVTIKLDITDEQLKLMQQDYKADNDTYRMCTMKVTIGSTTYTMNEVGVRIKGNTSRMDIYNGSNLNDRNLIHFRLSFKQTFDDADKYGSNAKVWASEADKKARKKRTFATLESLELKWNRGLDQTYIANAYVNMMFRDFGVYAQNTSLANVQFGGYNYGVYTMFEPVDEKFLTRYFGEGYDGGDLYKCQWGLKNDGAGNDWSGATYTTDTLNSMNPEKNGRTYIYELKTNKKKSPAAGQVSLKNLINTLDSNSSKQTFASVVDADNFVTYAAVAYFAGNPDDLKNNYNNHYVYFKNDGKAVIIPYDNDRCLGITTSNKQMFNYSPYAEESALQGGIRCTLYKNSVIGRNSNYYNEYTAALKKVYESKWLDYNNYLKYYNIAKKNYSSVAVPSSNVKVWIKDENTIYNRELLKFGEGNGKLDKNFAYVTVRDYLTKIKERYQQAVN